VGEAHQRQHLLHPVQSGVSRRLRLWPARQGPGRLGQSGQDGEQADGGADDRPPGDVPAYIRWEEYLANRARLKQNGYRVTENRLGAPRKGPALLSGLAACGHCGRRMSVTYSGSKSRGAYLCNALRATHGARSCLYVAARRVDEAVVEAFFEAIRPSEISLLEEVLAARSATRERLLKHHHDSVKAATYEVRLAEKRYRSVDPENRLVASELEKGWEVALRSLSDAREAAERFEREHRQTALDPDLRAQLVDFGKHLPKLWNSALLCVEHKKELLRSLIPRVVLSRPEQQNIESRIVWISSAVSTLSVRTPIRRACDLRDYEVLVGEILAQNAEGYAQEPGEAGGVLDGFGTREGASSGPKPHLQAHPKKCLEDAAPSSDRQPSHRGRSRTDRRTPATTGRETAKHQQKRHYIEGHSLGTVKTELLVHRRRFADREVARSAIFEYLEGF
jgi:hypothetical protein